MRVAILGCGPAGMFAAHAAVQRGWEVSILSKPRKSFMRGAQYLHRPIPGLSGEPFQVQYDLWGSVEGYRSKVYGEMEDILVSPETLVGTSDAWDIREAYDAAWDLYGEFVTEWDARENSIPESFDLVISTIPAMLLCSNITHEFFSTEVWAVEGLKRPHEVGFQQDGLRNNELKDNLVVCSGDPDDWWYRQSRIHGWENTEFPSNRKPNMPNSKTHLVVKPLSTTCDCHEDVVRLGRYGRWQKGVLSDAAYYDAEALLIAQEALV